MIAAFPMVEAKEMFCTKTLAWRLWAIGAGYPIFFKVLRPYPIKNRFQEFGTGPYHVNT